jgi:hypothetical protein
VPGDYIIAPLWAEPYNTGVLQPQLNPRSSGQGRVTEIRGGWRLAIPAGPESHYRLAQLDDYAKRSRRAFPWQPPVTLSLQARASTSASPGTWGFGLWNDPFGLSLGFGGGNLLPALPQAAWFFFASPENHLALKDHQPGNGALAGTFRASAAAWALAPAAPLLLLRPAARALRRAAAAMIPTAAQAIEVEPTKWHRYSINWLAEQVHFSIDGKEVLRTPQSPRAPLGLVLWIDNQYAAWRPSGQLAYGTLESQTEHWIEIKALQLA